MKRFIFILLLFSLFHSHTQAQIKFKNQVITTDGRIYSGNIQSYLSRKIIFYQDPEGLDDNSIGIDKIAIITGTMPESRIRRILDHNPDVTFISKPLEAEKIQQLRDSVSAGHDYLTTDREIPITPVHTRTWITLNTKPSRIMGELFELRDSSILIARSGIIQDYPHTYFQDRAEIVTLNIKNIETIQTRRNRSIIKQVAIGAVAGCAAGGAIALLREEPPPPTFGNWNDWTIRVPDEAYVIFFGLVGAGAGACVGSLRIVIPINGSLNNYNKYKNELRKYVVRKSHK